MTTSTSYGTIICTNATTRTTTETQNSTYVFTEYTWIVQIAQASLSTENSRARYRMFSPSVRRITGTIVLIIGVVFLIGFFEDQDKSTRRPCQLGSSRDPFWRIIIGSSLTKRRTAVIACGWSLLAVGALVGLTGFLLSNQIMCSCPAFGLCNCGCTLGQRDVLRRNPYCYCGRSDDCFRESDC